MFDIGFGWAFPGSVRWLRCLRVGELEDGGNSGRSCVEGGDQHDGGVAAVSVRVMVTLVASVGGDTCSKGVVWLWQCRLRYW